MARPDSSRKKLDVSAGATPLQSNPFAVLGELDALKNLPGPPPDPKSVSASGNGGRRPPLPAPPKSRGRLVLRRETKERGGKVVVIISGFAELPGANAVMIADLTRELKGKLGCGGSFDRREIVLQGDRPAEVAALLRTLGFRPEGVLDRP